MTIIYSLVARGPVILAEHATATGNFTTVAHHILEKLPSEDSKMSYLYDRYLFHYIQRNGICYLCLAEESLRRRVAFAFLDKISSTFEAGYGDRPQTAIAYGLNEFAKVLEKEMIAYSSEANLDRFSQVQGEIDNVKDVMVQNIQRVLERGDRIDILVDKTQNLDRTSFAFKGRATALRRREWWRNQKLMLICGVTGALLLYFFIGMKCGLPGFSECFDKTPKTGRTGTPQ